MTSAVPTLFQLIIFLLLLFVFNTLPLLLVVMVVEVLLCLVLELGAVDHTGGRARTATHDQCDGSVRQGQALTAQWQCLPSSTPTGGPMCMTSHAPCRAVMLPLVVLSHLMADSHCLNPPGASLGPPPPRRPAARLLDGVASTGSFDSSPAALYSQHSMSGSIDYNNLDYLADTQTTTRDHPLQPILKRLAVTVRYLPAAAFPSPPMASTHSDRRWAMALPRKICAS